MDIVFLALIAVLAAGTIWPRLRPRTPAEEQMSWIYVLGGLVAAALFVYLVVAMLKPEWFE